MARKLGPCKIILNEIDAKEVYYCTVREGGNSARINVPPDLVGKKVYVIVDPGGE